MKFSHRFYLKLSEVRLYSSKIRNSELSETIFYYLSFYGFIYRKQINEAAELYKTGT